MQKVINFIRNGQTTECVIAISSEALGKPWENVHWKPEAQLDFRIVFIVLKTIKIILKKGIIVLTSIEKTKNKKQTARQRNPSHCSYSCNTVGLTDVTIAKLC